ncbi:MAG TPA: hypothetical protein VHC22_33105 [Pirellulales bacterium]|nr:hypothetical protein [Pirellulales bacterium]
MIEGASAFSPDEIRAALFNELDVVAACESDALLTGLTTVIAEKTAAGYREAGFCDVDVKVAAEDGKLLMTIEEGEQFVNGAVDVFGNRRVDTEKIKAYLTRPDVPGLKKHQRWQPEKTASFGPETDARLTRHALASVNDQGFYVAQLQVRVEPDRSAKRATLHVDIGDEGRLSTLGDVVVAGNERNSREALMAHLELDAAAPLTRELREQIERGLVASGRFVEVRWELGEPENRDASWCPRLALKEFELAPSINEPVSREEAALLKLAEWIGQIGDGNDELLLEIGDGKTFFMLAPQRGFIVSAKVSDEDAAANDGPAFNLAIVMDEEQVGLYSGAQRRKLVAVPPPSPLMGQAIVNVIDGPPKWSGEGKFMLGAGARVTKKGDRRHMKVEIKLTAAAALSVLRHHKANCQWDGDVLSCAWDKYRLRVNSLTGQLVDYVKDDKDDEASSTRLLVAEPGEFDRRRREIENASADWPNVADARRPLSCLAEFVCYEMELQSAARPRSAGHVFDDLKVAEEVAGDAESRKRFAELRKEIDEAVAEEMAESRERTRRGYAALRKAISLEMLEPFDRLPYQIIQWQDERFSIPLPFFHFESHSFGELAANLRKMAPLFGVRVGNVLFPAEGWMNSAWHQYLFAVANKPSFLAGHRPSVGDRTVGALRALATAELLWAAGDEFGSKIWALKGLRPRSEAAFRNECGELVSGEGFVSQLLLSTVATVRQLDLADIEALTGLLVGLDMVKETQAGALEFAALRARTEDSPAKGATQALNALWRAGLASWIERRLDKLADIPEERVDR